MQNIQVLNRFTTIPILLDYLERKKMVLLNPASWDDKNDSEIMKEYQNRKGLSNLCAICFSHGSETIHHWKTFSNGISGCVIEFDFESLINIFNHTENIRHGEVKYHKIHDLSVNDINISDIPFTKRWPYRYEEEYRVIWESNSNNETFEIEVPVTSINKITISQQMPEKVYKTIESLLAKSLPCATHIINRSTIYENKEWIGKFQNI